MFESFIKDFQRVRNEFLADSIFGGVYFWNSLLRKNYNGVGRRCIMDCQNKFKFYAKNRNFSLYWQDICNIMMKNVKLSLVEY